VPATLLLMCDVGGAGGWAYGFGGTGGCANEACPAEPKGVGGGVGADGTGAGGKGDRSMGAVDELSKPDGWGKEFPSLAIELGESADDSPNGVVLFCPNDGYGTGAGGSGGAGMENASGPGNELDVSDVPVRFVGGWDAGGTGGWELT
jgi:hypothetical protein